MADTEERLQQIVEAVRRAIPRAEIVLSTVYDPSDGTGILDGIDLRLGLPLLERYNRAVGRIAHQHGCRLADLHGHFLRHGVAAPSAAERWYWSESIIEPAALGASEVRRIWVDALRVIGLVRGSAIASSSVEMVKAGSAFGFAIVDPTPIPGSRPLS